MSEGVQKTLATTRHERYPPESWNKIWKAPCNDIRYNWHYWSAEDSIKMDFLRLKWPHVQEIAFNIILMGKWFTLFKLLFAVYVCVWFSHVWLFATPWTVAHQAPLSMEFSRQEYWSGLPFPSPGALPNPVVEPGSPGSFLDAPNDPCFLILSPLYIPFPLWWDL